VSSIDPEWLEVFWLRLDKTEDEPAVQRDLEAERIYQLLQKLPVRTTP